MVCILYVTGLTALLGIIALLAEQTLPERAPRRWLWFAAVMLSVTIPPIYTAKHRLLLEVDAGNAATVWSHISIVDSIVMKLWLLTTISLAIWGVAGMVRIAWSTRKQDGPVVTHPNLGPATVGLLRTRVIIPAWVRALPSRERRLILQHEYEHKRAQDTRLLFAASLTLLASPWNVALWWLMRRLSLAVEIDCDNRVLARRTNTLMYGELLLKVGAQEHAGPRVQPASLGGVGMLERRLRHMLAPTRRSTRQRVALFAMACAVLVIALATPHPVLHTPAPAHHQSNAHR